MTAAFLSIFKWEARKGWDELLEAYLSAFKYNDPVELYLVTKSYNQSVDLAPIVHDWVRLTTGVDKDHVSVLPRVYLITQPLSDTTLLRLYRSVDAVVLPTHGEGWGRPQMEAMAMGLPVITTNWWVVCAALQAAVCM